MMSKNRIAKTKNVVRNSSSLFWKSNIFYLTAYAKRKRMHNE